MTPLFGAALAVQVDAVLAATAGREIVEFGAGTGRLAADLLIALAARDALPSRYAIVEVSPDLAERQRATIAAAAPALAGRVEWLAGVPATDRRRRGDERGARRDPAARRRAARRRAAGARRGLERRARGPSPSTTGRRIRASRRSPPRAFRRSPPRASPAGVDYLSEINPAAEALVETIGRRLAGGALLVVDYGFPAAEYYHPQRDQGTLMGHYRHRAHADPFLWPGLSDLTAHVDFSAIAARGPARRARGRGLHRPGAVPAGLRHPRRAGGAGRAGRAGGAARDRGGTKAPVPRRDGRALQGAGAGAHARHRVAGLRAGRPRPPALTAGESRPDRSLRESPAERCRASLQCEWLNPARHSHAESPRRRSQPAHGVRGGVRGAQPGARRRAAGDDAAGGVQRHGAAAARGARRRCSFRRAAA